MYSVDDPDAGPGSVIAVIGGGASGTLAAIYLLREAAAGRLPLQVALIDRYGRHGLGQAYSTTHPAHLLNSPAGAMSALAGDPGHLARWAAEAGLPHDGFLPRSAYGRYLTGLLAATERSARPAARVSRITSEVVAIQRGGHGRALRLHLAADGRIDADAAVLATGNLAPVPVCAVPPYLHPPSRANGVLGDSVESAGILQGARTRRLAGRSGRLVSCPVWPDEGPREGSLVKFRGGRSARCRCLPVRVAVVWRWPDRGWLNLVPVPG